MSAPKGVRVRKGKVEGEIEKLRSDSNWHKAIELIQPYKNDSGLSYLYFLIMCESKLDNYEQDYLSENDLQFCSRCLDEAIKTPDSQYKLEASILRGEILYFRKSLMESLKILRSLNLHSIKLENYGARSCRIISEGLAVMGLCIEGLAEMTRRVLSDSEKNETISHYELACDLSIRHFQELYLGATEYVGQSVSLPKVVFTAIQRLFMLTCFSGDVHAAISQFRLMLRSLETPPTRMLRQWLSCQLAELLLRGLCEKTYQKYDLVTEKKMIISNKVLPYRYPVNRYVPESLYREAILMLLVSEHIASGEVILNRPSEISDARIRQSFNNTSAVYDLLAIALARTGKFTFLYKTLEKSLKFSYREFHIWYQFALSLISAGKYYRAYLVLRECLRLDSTRLAVFLLTTSLCLGSLDFIEDGFELACQTVEIASMQEDSVMCARAHLMLGWAYSLLARRCRVAEKKRELQREAISEYKLATQLDPDDYLAWYHVAVELATQRKLDEALSSCQQSLRLMPTHSRTLYLLALLYSAGGKRIDQAAKVLRVGLADAPNDFQLHFLLARVEGVRQGPKTGMMVYRRVLGVWRDTFSPGAANASLLAHLHDSKDFSSATIASSEDLTSVSYQSPNGPNLDLGEGPSQPVIPWHTTPLAAALADISFERVAQTGAFIIPSASKASRPNRPSDSRLPNTANRIQAKIYHGLSELYLENGQLSESSTALDEAVKLTGFDIETVYLRGCLTERQGMLTKARAIYESVIAIQPNHLSAHLSLASLLCNTNQASLAERVIRDAMNLDPTCCRVWHLLGQILNAPSAGEPASDTAVTKALLNAAELQQSEPLQPFYELPIGIQCH